MTTAKLWVCPAAASSCLDIEDTRDVGLTATESRTTGVREATFIVFTPEDVVVGDQYFVELYDYQETQRIEHLHRDPYRVRLYDRSRAWAGYYDGLTEVEQEYERVVYVASRRRPADQAGGHHL